MHTDTQRTREHMEDSVKRLRKTLKGDPDFSIEPIAAVRVGKYDGLMLSFTHEGVNIASHRHTPAPPPVARRDTTIFLNTPGGQYMITFAGPIVLYEKYRATFERVLQTFEWIPG